MLVAQRIAREAGGGEAGGLDVDRQFLRQFADKRFLGRLAGFDLAAGEFPQARHRLACGTPLHEQAAVAVDKRRGGDDEAVFRGFCGGFTGKFLNLPVRRWARTEEHTSELPSLMSNSYAVFCIKKKTEQTQQRT